MALTLTPEPTQTLAGTTLFSDEAAGPGSWARPTGVYIPPGVDLSSGVVNVVLYLHGWFVTDIKQLFKSDPAAIRKQLLASSANTILVAPWLGNGHKGGGTYSVSGLTGSWGETYLGQVISALAAWRGPTADDINRMRDQLHTPTPWVRLGKLAIACHSGGGEAMRYLVGSLGRYKINLKECWGFDCLYGINASPDDANFWFNWVRGGDGRPLYISFGPSTVPQSVKLFLMAGGIATEQGARREPEGPDTERIHVKLGMSDKYIDDLMDLDKLLEQSTPKPKHHDPFGNDFVSRAAGNLRKNAHWPPDNQLMDLHYRIASEGLLERLNAASFF